MVNARSAGLWMVDDGSDKQVMKAKEHLLALLDDPYYFEAYQILLRAKHPRLRGRRGRPSEEIGALAHRLQNDSDSGPDTEKHHGPGRPCDQLTPNMERVRVGLEKLPGSLKSNCRKFIKAWLGYDSDSAAEWLYSKIRSNRRNSRREESPLAPENADHVPIWRLFAARK